MTHESGGGLSLMPTGVGVVAIVRRRPLGFGPNSLSVPIRW